MKNMFDNPEKSGSATPRKKAPCADCPYKLGEVQTLVNPCPQCKENGYNMYEQFLRRR